MLEQFSVDLRTYRDYNSVFDDLQYGEGKLSAEGLCKRAAYNRAKTSEIEAYVILILYRNMAKEKSKAIKRCEEDYAPTRQLMSETVHALLYKGVQVIKKGST